MKKFDWNNNEAIKQAVLSSKHLRGTLANMGLKDGGMVRARLKEKIRDLTIDTSHFAVNQRPSVTVWDDERVVKHVVSESKSLADVVRGMKQTLAGTSYATAKRVIKKFNIDTSHFDPRLASKITKAKNFYAPMLLTEALVKNSTYGRASLKKRLVEEQLLEYKCNKCGNNGEWMGEQLTLQIEHKNGIGNDNRLENLEFLCPNCHTQTKTWGSRNRNNTNKE